MSTCPIRIERITKRYGKTIGVSDVSLDFPTGHVACIVGESGSGKTTLINVLLGLIKPTAGRVFPAQQAALVLQDSYTSLSPLLTIEQSMAEPFKLAKKTHRRSPYRLGFFSPRPGFFSFSAASAPRVIRRTTTTDQHRTRRSYATRSHRDGRANIDGGPHKHPKNRRNNCGDEARRCGCGGHA